MSGAADSRGSVTPRDRTLAGVLEAAGLVWLAFVFPVLMILANKSAPLSLGVAALLGLGAAASAGDLRGCVGRIRDTLSTPLAMLLLVVAGVCLLSFVWTVSLPRSWRTTLEIVPVIAAGIIAMAVLPDRMRASRANWLAFGILAACALLVFEWALDMPIHRFFGARSLDSDLKRSVTPLAVLAWPAIALLAPRGHRLGLALAVVLAAGLAAGLAHSGSALLGTAAGALAFIAARCAPRPALALAAAATVAVLAMSVLTGPIVDRSLPGAIDQRIERFHASHRIQIWTAFGKRIAERPLIGHGFGASQDVSDAPRPAGYPVDTAVDRMIDNIHPHNAPLQIWAELGLAGALLALGVGGMVLWGWRNLTPARLAPRLAAYSSVVAVSLVGFGMWQPWWIATICATTVWFASAQRRFDA